ncbi:hypothetical protein ACOMHN_009037 [Nucella lapillus]
MSDTRKKMARVRDVQLSKHDTLDEAVHKIALSMLQGEQPNGLPTRPEWLMKAGKAAGVEVEITMTFTQLIDMGLQEVIHNSSEMRTEDSEDKCNETVSKPDPPTKNYQAEGNETGPGEETKGVEQKVTEEKGGDEGKKTKCEKDDESGEENVDKVEDQEERQEQLEERLDQMEMQTDHIQQTLAEGAEHSDRGESEEVTAEPKTRMDLKETQTDTDQQKVFLLNLTNPTREEGSTEQKEGKQSKEKENGVQEMAEGEMSTEQKKEKVQRDGKHVTQEMVDEETQSGSVQVISSLSGSEEVNKDQEE